MLIKTVFKAQGKSRSRQSIELSAIVLFCLLGSLSPAHMNIMKCNLFIQGMQA